MQLSFKNLAFTFLGGVLGTWLRFAIAQTANTFDTLFIVNILGSAALGYFTAHKNFQTDAKRSFWSVGLCGGFTTMSGVALWLNIQQFNTTAVALVIIMFVAGIAAYFGGTKLVRK